ncbi:mannose-1-phosphate guanylyltransferase [Thermosipho melanesiensis]|uniref:mannose-1-phosphate guanylyltransferase n=2 Tax=Thermosipho melanesiensis TaxID=46541 RepID=A6LKR6_THEM4|nr:mannose-1-phosphate guanylyltransferase [Thermosipho melanesiensis]ABR30517.1 Mannose-1-phosphate guanylyltransferase (GDP) [Thermosipho melanesiensis BI429]APT73668.1 mannose-1-phosphate guanylyltransferase [Thermosipho melanesiensis]OOC35608.1 mannose-1-phosphate guanylyltransferase [Thermosipho melanesiensis]OOC39282.1 mannose-1-phosphate guanylyltransferase [Thermosipho melanesiensis]OOC39368.1 mannose-1-phosphate guanylyltransferase [Thermosipho melanesiensis]
MNCALIMAGGKGERFWPYSTDEKPKQFINLFGEKTMIQQTVDRLDGFLPIENIFIVTGEKYVNLVKKQLPNLPEKNIIVEPEGRNTAPCIALSAFYIKKIYGNVNLAVFPADHLVRDVEVFRKTLSLSFEFVEAKEDVIVTLGIKPDRPETGYGYIKFLGEDVKINESILKVERFVEKPDKLTAERYVNEGKYLWNAGIFVWKIDTILKNTKEFLPNTYGILKNVFDKKDLYEELKIAYKKVDKISVDFGIMEHAKNIYVIPVDFGWDDVGSWIAVERYSEKDEDGNVISQNIHYFDSKRNIVKSKKKTILNGVNDLVVIETDEYLIVSHKDSISKIKDIKNKIE